MNAGLHSRGPGLAFGCSRVLTPPGALPQAAERLDAAPPLYDNEVLIEVKTLNIDSASFAQLRGEAKKAATDEAGIKAFIRKEIFATVKNKGKQINPVTGSGGMLVGAVRELGKNYHGASPLKVGDPVATLVSLTLTPLALQEIDEVHLHPPREAQIECRGTAILCDSAPLAALPGDLPQELALSVLDVCGAPAQMPRIVKPRQKVLVLGAGGKSGLLCLHMCREILGASGLLMAIDYSPQALKILQDSKLADRAAQLDVRQALEILACVRSWTDGTLADVVINTANVPFTETAAILSTRAGGLAYFFNMATDFSRSTLGAEGLGKDIVLMMGNGFVPGHAELALNILRKNAFIRDTLTRRFARPAAEEGGIH